MNESNPTPAAPAADMGLMARLTNILAAPGEVFDALAAAPHRLSNWLVPVAVYMVVMVVTAGVVMSQPVFKQQIVELQMKALDQQVEKGKLKPEQADQARKALETLPAWVFQIGAVIQGILVGGVGWLWWSFVLWLLGSSLMRGGFPFVKALEAAGVAHVILILGLVVQTLLMFVMGHLMARPAPSLLVGEFDMENRLHLGLGALNAFYLWFAAVMAVAAARLGRLPLSRCLLVFFGFWVLVRVVLIGIGGGFGALVL